MVEEALSRRLGKKTHRQCKRSTSNFRARDRRTGGGRNLAHKGRDAAQWSGGAAELARAWDVSKETRDFAGNEARSISWTAFAEEESGFALASLCGPKETF